MSRIMRGFVNVDEQRFEARMAETKLRNDRLQSLGILQVRAEMIQTIQNRWDWVDQLPDEFKENGLFIENLKEELRQEASQMIQKQKEMGMDKAHLRQLEEMLEIN